MHRTLSAGAAALLLALAACSSSAGGTSHGAKGDLSSAATGSSRPAAAAAPNASCPRDITAQICVTVALTGAANVTGTGRTTAPAPVEAQPSWTCRKLAGFSGGEYDLGDNLQSVGGHGLKWDASLGRYHGPGTYPLTGTEFYVNVDQASYMAAGSNATASVTVGADLSVTFRFNGLADADTKGQISGTLRWTCADPE